LLVIENVSHEYTEQIKQLDGIIELCGAVDRLPSIESNSPLARMLID